MPGDSDFAGPSKQMRPSYDGILLVDYMLGLDVDLCL
jgi:hypothetical protein